MTTAAGRVVLQFGVDDAALQSGLRTVQQQIRSLGSGLQSFARGFAPISAGFAAVGFAGVTMAADLNKAMANVASLIPDATTRVAELKTGIQELAPAIGVTTADLADGAYQVISAFGDTADTLSILDTNARAAAAGVATTTDAINLTSAVTKGYGDTSAVAVEKAADLALLAVRLGQTTFPELAASIGRVTPLTAELGVTQEELFGVMATATGVTGGAAEVSTQLRGVLQSLMKPTEAMTGLFASLGVESGKALLEQRGLQGSIDAIVSAATEAGVPLGEYLGSIEGQTLALALAGSQSETFTQKLSEMQDAAGATDEAFRAQTEGINAAGYGWAQLQSTLQVMAQQIGDVIIPVLLSAAEGVKPMLAVIVDLVRWVGTLPEPVQTVIVGLGGLVAAAAPVAYVLGGLITAVSTITGLFAAGSTGAAVLGGALTVLTGPIGLIAAAVVGLGAVWYKWGDDITAVVTAAYDTVKTWLWDKLEPVLVPIGELLQSLMRMFEAFGRLVGAVLRRVLDVHIEVVRGITMWLVERLQPIFEPLRRTIESIGAVFGAVKDIVVNAARLLYEGVKTWMLDRFTSIVDGIKAKVDAVTGFFENMYTAVVGNSFVPDMVSGIESSFAQLQTVMVDPASLAVGAVNSLFSGMQGVAGTVMGALESIIGTSLENMLGSILDKVPAFQSAWQSIMSPSVGIPLPGGGSIGIPNPTFMMGKAWLESFLGPHGNPGTAPEDMPEELRTHENQREHGFTIDGTPLDQVGEPVPLSSGGIVNAGAGRPAMLHGYEGVFPLPPGFDLASSLQALQGTGGQPDRVTEAIEAVGRRFDRSLMELRTMLPLELRHALGTR